MRWVVLVLAACGGSSPPPEKPPEPKVTRLPVETDKDDEPEDGVTFTKQKGQISQEAIEAGLAPKKDAMMDCYTAKIGKRKWLGGEVMLHWELKADGSIHSVKLSQSDVGDWSIEKCLLDLAWEASFAKPKGGDADFDLPLTFSPTRITQDWDEDKSLRAIGGQLAQLDDCPDGPKPKGKKPKPKKPPPKQAAAKPERPEPRPPKNVLVTLYVGPQGKTQAVGFASPSSEIGDKWATCAQKVASAWRLPDPRGQIAKLKIRYKAE